MTVSQVINDIGKNGISKSCLKKYNYFTNSNI